MRLAVETFRAAAVCLVMLLVGTQGLFADEPAARFLEALRDKGYYDIALEYLEKAKDNPNVPDEFRKRISYEKAITLIDQVGQLNERKKIDAQLDTAQKLLRDYAASNNSLVETTRSLKIRSLLLSRRADVYLREAEATQLTEGERQQLQLKARGYLVESLETVGETLATAKRLLEPTSRDAIKISADDPRSRDLKKEIEGIYRVMTVQRPLNAEQLAGTFPERSTERKQLLTDAATKYKQIWEGSYSNTVPGVRACLHAGLCNQKLGNHEDALDFFKQVISLDRIASVNALQKQAFAAAGDSWQQVEPYPARSVIAQLESVVEGLSRSEARDPVWLRVKLELGIAKYELSKIVKQSDGQKGITKSKSILREAGVLVRDVTRVRNPHRDRARALLEEWDVPLIESAELADEKPQGIKTFAAALEAGSDAISNVGLLAGESIRANLAERTAPEAEREKLTAVAAELKEKLRTQSDQAIAKLDLALSLTKPTTSADEINQCRFLKCYCYHVSGRHLEVGVIGQYLVDRHPNETGTKGAAGLLLKSRAKLLAAAPKDNSAVELKSLKNTALVVAKLWPGSPESGEALKELIVMALNDGNVPQAVELMDQLPEDSASRAKLAGAIGQSLWNTYLQDLRDPKLAINTNEMKNKLDEAFRFLKLSESLTKSESMSYTDAVNGLNLVNAMLAQEKPEEALKVLEASPMSPLQVIKSKNPAVFGSDNADGYKSSAYNVIIKTYLARLATADNQQVWIDKINGTIELMRQEAKASGSAGAQSQLTAIYYLISVELGKRFENTTDSKQRLQMAGALADFMDPIEQSSTNGRVLLKAGANLLMMATELSEEGMQGKAKGLFLKSSNALTKAEKLGFAGESQEAALKVELNRQRALAQRGAGQYQQAVATFTKLLTTSKSLSMQLDAASTLQQWGKSAGLSKPFAQAVNGTGKAGNGKNPIWGWSRIMRLTQRDKAKYRDQYFTAAYGVAEAIYEQAKITKSGDGKERALKQIKRERTKTPDFLGSKVWKAKFDALEKRVRSGG